jgi:hypothetical protein
MKNYNAEKVAVTVHLTEEAARALYAYAGERNRGRFLSDLIMEQRRRDELEGQAVAEQAHREATERAAGAAKTVRATRHVGGHSNKGKKRH